MAELGNYSDKLIQDDEMNQQQPGGGSVQPSAGTSGVVSGGPGAASTAGVGAGGTGGWTNIQAYLGANKADSGSSNLLESKAGGQYDQENQNLQTQASTVKTQAQSEADKINDAKDHSKEWVNQAANAYSWEGKPGDDYTNNVGKLKGAINGQYAGPNNFAFQKSADFQKTGAALGDDSSFSNYMNNLYKDKAGGTLTSGQGALQTQLDVNNQGLADARKNLLGKYSGFDDNIKQTVNDSDAAIQKAKQDYGNNQSALKDYLGNYGNDLDSQISKEENDARGAYQNTYNSDSGRKNYTVNGVYGEGINFGQLGLGANDATWNQIANFARPGIAQGAYDLADDFGRGDSFRGIVGQANSLYDQNAGALNDFYSQQDQKYANTADPEERQWNTIMDVLGRSDRKQQGFKVRG